MSVVLPSPARPRLRAFVCFGWRLTRNRLAAVMLLVLAAYALVAVLVQLNLIATDWNARAGPSFAAPSWSYPFGTDRLGRSVLLKLLHGARNSLAVMTLASLVSLAMGTLLGLIAGTFRGVVDDIIVWLYTTLAAIPGLLMMLAFAFVLRDASVFGYPLVGVPTLCLALGLTSWVGTCRLVRGEVIKHQEQGYVLAARALGGSRLRIALRHILPNVMHVVIIQVSLHAVGFIRAEVVLSFLGLGDGLSWGAIIDEARFEIGRNVWWQMAAASGAVFLLSLAINVVGDALRDALDPRLGDRAPARPDSHSRSEVPREASPDSAPPCPDALLHVVDLRTHFATAAGDLVAVDGVSLCVRRGEALALIGESGCGKSVTALSVMRLLENPTAHHPTGQVLLDDLNLLKATQRQLQRVRGRRIAMVFQEPGASLDPIVRIGRQLEDTIRLHHPIGRAEARRHGVELLRQVRVPNPEARLRAFPHELSGGLQQRVLMALALSGEPELLVADEPTTSLDVTVQAEILELLASLQHERRLGLLLITHDLGVAARVADRVAILYAGRIVEEGAARQVYAQPEHPYTAALLKAQPHLGRGEPVVSIPGQLPDPLEFPHGCRFAPRCPEVLPRCRLVDPRLAELHPGQLVACWQRLPAPPAAQEPSS